MIKAKRGSRPEATFPFTKVFGGREYYQSLLNPTFVENCTKQRAVGNAKMLRNGGKWLARVVKFETTVGSVYIVYERKVSGAHKGVR